MGPKPRIVFVCVENSNRSQMAEAFARMLAGDAVDAHSAGSAPSGKVNPRAIQFMAERGYDLSTHTSKSLDDLPVGDYAAAITMGCGDSCPMIVSPIHEDWGITDPKHLPDEEFRQIRDGIETKVRELLGRIGVPVVNHG
ncbi:arsenate reductase ArsC [Tuwongella immobilis]|uniref:Phosphotyrosine protein phosphatase I domain-containing protein n=1 Tax=Tuwongella immobilis TaxID=692036 RepID=A0A6C2YKU0_9BACT|nr:arsenate reductase ArsC [Tuwongella immobilis]VIP01921.1 protein tyrosine phosphatase : Protein tyrosine phosphatase OS=Chlorobium sp. GBChlB GN=HY22_09850 PE=4 SV=1: LMWPc [Tuwongella immobilis]VTR99851.1 protein tyrosine phosphatase : Protein tyrosine phosphatase OS=Chlorobium sp. GBChlB GN=HY22_09850 PE=4 SV=1: LMWPc [Tuwongella immobilis]